MNTDTKTNTNTSSSGRGELHPEVKTVLDLFEELEVPDFYKKTPDQARELFRGLRPQEDALPPIHHREDMSIDVDGGSIKLRVYRPSDDAQLPVLMWFHGGGWVFGDLESGELACRELCDQANCVIVSVDYRLAPEHRFPVALDDCIRATEWVMQQAAQLSIDVERMAVGGDSAGGNLAAAVAQHARDGNIKLKHQLLVYPVTQASVDTQSYLQNAQGYFLSRESMIWFWDHYVPDVQQRQDVRVSPLNGRVDGLAPAWILTCAFDPLCDDGRMYAETLRTGGVEVAHHHRDDAIHGVFGMAIDVGAQIRTIAAKALREAFAAGA